MCPSTIGAGGLNFRVRDGNGCGPSAIATRNFHTIPLSNLKLPSWKLECAPSKLNSVEVLKQAYILRSSPRPISTSQLKASLPLHSWPIYLVICKGSYPPQGKPREGGKPHLEVGFTLRCFQRLSHPDVATQRCPWRDNWYTRGPSTPVLSY